MWYHWLSASSFLIAMLLADFTTAAVYWDEMLVKHAWNAVPANWVSMGNTTAGAMINLHIALQPNQESALIEALSEISDPAHPRYGAYLSKKEVAEIVSPHPHTFELVRAWLLHYGIRSSSISTSHGGSWLTVTDVLVSQANQFLGASYQLYRNSKTNDMVIRTTSYALPAELHTLIQTVAPTTYFPSTRGTRKTPRKREAPEQAQPASGKVVTARVDLGLTPSALRWFYKTNTYRPYAPYRNTLGILGIDNDYPSKLDLAHFMTRYRFEGRDTDFTVIQVNGGGYNPSNPGNTSSLSVQYASAIAYPTPLVFYSVGGDTEWDHNGVPIVASDMYLVWLHSILDQESPPQTISIPYGEPEWNLPRLYASSVCALFAQLGNRGVSVLVASGNDGVGGGDCMSPQGDLLFVPEFPASCPWVTTVGGTSNFRPEMATNLSGGGFSFFFERPWYQRTAVGKYMVRYPDLHDGLFDRDGRGYPDISAQALNYPLIVNGEMLYMDGTTCSVSTVAGIVSLFHDFRAFKNKRPLGFLNTMLYSRFAKGITDVQFGANTGCNRTGFMAAPGWDPATGLGTLDLEGMLDNIG